METNPANPKNNDDRNNITWCEIITHLNITPRDSLPIKGFESLNRITGTDNEDDRSASKERFYSNRPEAGRLIARSPCSNM